MLGIISDSLILQIFTEWLAHAGLFTSSVDDKMTSTYKPFLIEPTVQEETHTNDYDTEVTVSCRGLGICFGASGAFPQAEAQQGSWENVDFVVIYNTFSVLTLTPISWRTVDNLPNVFEQFSPLVMVSCMSQFG